MRYSSFLCSAIALVFSASAFGHGLMSDPASRNWFCGAVTKPDTAEEGSACAEAFEGDFEGGYQFMSVLTHDLGRKGVSPLPDNVCGFDSETWDGGATPWDKPIDWPTNAIDPGPLTITWDISWGPHFDDTEEFVYYITKPGFEYEVGEPLSWDDFESEPFCDLTGYDNTNPDASPNITPEEGESLFHTQCTVPERSGRHVIYGEWGRNEYTYERFHGCVDVEFGGGDPQPDPVVADISASPDDSQFTGAGEISLSADGSQGSDLSYSWSVEAANDSLYSLSSTSGSNTTLSLDEPDTESQVTVRLQVSNSEANDTASYAFTHAPAAGSDWQDLGALTDEARTLAEGDEVQLRLVTEAGADVYLPSSAFVVSDGAADSWTLAFAQAVNGEGGDVSIGVLSEGDVEPTASATDNRVYAELPSDYTGAFLEVEEAGDDDSGGDDPTTGTQCNWYGETRPLCTETDSGWGWEDNESCVGPDTCAAQPDPYGIIGEDDSGNDDDGGNDDDDGGNPDDGTASASCEHQVENDWGSGFTGQVVITNNGDSAIDGWSVNWSYSGDVSIGNSWNVELSGSNPFTATDMGWNGQIAPGESVSFGFQASGPAESPEVNGEVCN